MYMENNFSSETIVEQDSNSFSSSSTSDNIIYTYHMHQIENRKYSLLIYPLMVINYRSSICPASPVHHVDMNMTSFVDTSSISWRIPAFQESRFHNWGAVCFLKVWVLIMIMREEKRQCQIGLFSKFWKRHDGPYFKSTSTYWLVCCLLMLLYLNLVVHTE